MHVQMYSVLQVRNAREELVWLILSLVRVWDAQQGFIVNRAVVWQTTSVILILIVSVVLMLFVWILDAWVINLVFLLLIVMELIALTESVGANSLNDPCLNQSFNIIYCILWWWFINLLINIEACRKCIIMGWNRGGFSIARLFRGYGWGAFRIYVFLFEVESDDDGCLTGFGICVFRRFTLFGGVILTVGFVRILPTLQFWLGLGMRNFWIFLAMMRMMVFICMEILGMKNLTLILNLILWLFYLHFFLVECRCNPSLKNINL